MLGAPKVEMNSSNESLLANSFAVDEAVWVNNIIP